MIRSFRCKETEGLFGRRFSRRLPEAVQRIARRKLEILDAAERLEDLRIPPANRLEKLHGKRPRRAAFVMRESPLPGVFAFRAMAAP